MSKCKKRKYTKEVAERLAKDFKRKAKKVFGHTDRHEKRSYLCHNCKCYHLTSISQNEWELREKKKRLEEKNKKEQLRIIKIKKEKEFQAILKSKGHL